MEPGTNLQSHIISNHNTKSHQLFSTITVALLFCNYILVFLSIFKWFTYYTIKIGEKIILKK